MKMKNVSLYVASILFLIIAIGHFARYLAKVSILVGAHHTIPVEWSLYGGIVTLILSIWMFVAAKMQSRYQGQAT